MRVYDRDQPLIFIHIPKAAGNSTRKIFQGWYGDGFLTHYFDETNGISPPKYDLARLHTPDRPVIVYGHFNRERKFGVEHDYPGVTQFVTILRDPFERAISNYFFNARLGSSWRDRLVEGSDSIIDYVSKRKSDFLAHFPRQVTRENYKEIIEEYFIEIGLVEFLEESMQRIAGKLARSFEPSALGHLNKSERNQAVPGYLRNVFRERNQLEFEVYDFVCRGFIQKNLVTADSFQVTGTEADSSGSSAQHHPELVPRLDGIVPDALTGEDMEREEEMTSPHLEPGKARSGWEKSAQIAGVSLHPELDGDVRRAEDCLSAGDLTGAEKILVSVLELDPEHEGALNCLAVVFLISRRFLAAQSILEVIRQRNPENETTRDNAGILREHFTACAREQEKCMAATSAELDHVLADLSSERNGVRPMLESILERYPRHAWVHNKLGLLAFDDGNVEGAYTCFRQAVEYLPQDTDYLANLADVCLISGRSAEAVSYCEELFSQFPNNAETLIRLGVAYEDCGRLDEASGAYQRVLEIDPDNEKARTKLARLSGR